MSRFDNMAYVRVRVYDTAEASRRSKLVAEYNAKCESNGDKIKDEYWHLVRYPMWVEVSSDKGKTWAVLPTKEGTNFWNGKIQLPHVDVRIPIVSDIWDGTITLAELPQLPTEVCEMISEQHV